jgi:hypothetical protein
MSNCFHTFSSSDGISGTHFIPLLYHISQSLRTSWHAIKYLPTVTPPADLIANTNANASVSESSVPATPVSASSGGKYLHDVCVCMLCTSICVFNSVCVLTSNPLFPLLSPLFRPSLHLSHAVRQKRKIRKTSLDRLYCCQFGQSTIQRKLTNSVNE